MGEETYRQSSPAAAGWYVDPNGNGGLRWWDGTSWTDDMADAPSAEDTPLPPPGPDAGPLGDTSDDQGARATSRLPTGLERYSIEDGAVIGPDSSPLSTQDQERWKARCSVHWERFPEIAGVRLRIISSTGWERRKDKVVLAGEGVALASVLMTLVGSRFSRIEQYRLQYLSTDQTCVLHRVGRRRQRTVTDRLGELDGERELVDVATQGSILRFVGAHRNGIAGLVVHLSDGRSLRFPVQGTNVGDAIAVAVDEAGNQLLRFRNVVEPRLAHTVRLGRSTEVVVAQTVPITTDLIWVMYVAAHLIPQFFFVVGGGG